MGTQSSLHYHLNWLKARIDEMDAALASLEGQSRGLAAAAQMNADLAIADLRKRRDEFAAAIEALAKAGGSEWKRTETRLESEWASFQAKLAGFVKDFGADLNQQQAIFRSQAEAQAGAWRDAAGQLATAAKTLAEEQKAKVDALAKHMELEAEQAQQRLRKLEQAGDQSWTTLMTALAETRAAFDRANKAAQEAIGRSLAD